MTTPTQVRPAWAKYAGRIPAPLLRGLANYVDLHQPTGDFLRTVLSNDLMGAIGRGDAESLVALPLICELIYNDMPSKCHGSPEAVRAWLAQRVEPGADDSDWRQDFEARR